MNGTECYTEVSNRLIPVTIAGVHESYSDDYAIHREFRVEWKEGGVQRWQRDPAAYLYKKTPENQVRIAEYNRLIAEKDRILKRC